MIKVIRMSGTPRERGEIYGEEARELIREGLDAWRVRLAEFREADVDGYLERFVSTSGFEAAMQRHTPELLDEVAGIAAASGSSYAEVLAYCMVDEEWWWAMERQGTDELPVFACTSLARTFDGHTVAGQNLDVPARYDGQQVLLMIEEEESVTACVTAAGNLGWSGCNSWGIGKCGNALVDLPHSEQGLPVQAVVRGMLKRRTFAEATAWVKGLQHASGQNYIVAGQGNVTTLECSGERVEDLGEGRASVCHTNHALRPYAGGAKLAAPIVGDSKERLAFVEERVDTLDTADEILDVLADRTVPITRDTERMMTVVAIAMELDKGEIVVTAGPPSRTERERFSLV